MNKKLVRIIAIILILSPWIYISDGLMDLLMIILGIVLMASTVHIHKKKDIKE